jgi:hypothetical protein
MHLPQCQRSSFKPIQNHRQNYSLAYSNFDIFIDNRREDRRFRTE